METQSVMSGATVAEPGLLCASAGDVASFSLQWCLGKPNKGLNTHHLCGNRAPSLSTVLLKAMREAVMWHLCPFGQCGASERCADPELPLPLRSNKEH